MILLHQGYIEFQIFLLMASGDDDGLIKTWDQRQAESIASFEVHTDFVADMVLNEHEQCLVAVSGDGTLSVTDQRTNKVCCL